VQVAARALNTKTVLAHGGKMRAAGNERHIHARRGQA
jgi:hypothetical protein